MRSSVLATPVRPPLPSGRRYPAAGSAKAGLEPGGVGWSAASAADALGSGPRWWNNRHGGEAMNEGSGFREVPAADVPDQAYLVDVREDDEWRARRAPCPATTS